MKLSKVRYLDHQANEIVLAKSMRSVQVPTRWLDGISCKLLAAVCTRMALSSMSMRPNWPPEVPSWVDDMHDVVV